MTIAWERAVGWAACAAAVILLLGALVGGRVEASPELTVHGATVRLAAVPGRPAAGYFMLNGGPATLVSVASPLATRVEMHSSSMAGGVMRMDALPAVVVRADAPVTFAPGGNHLMLFGMPASVKPGSTVPLLFRFADGRTVRVEASTVAAGAAMTMHGAH